MTTAPLLVVGIGNPSRGDDAIGPLFVERATQALKVPIARGAMELLTDFQLQVEHALDLEGRTRVIFVDASVTAAAPFDLSRIAARRDASVLTHAMTPEGVLEVHRSLVGEPPDAWLLAIRGYTFELGDPLSEAAKAHLDAALEHFFAFTRACGEVAGAPPEPGALESRGVRLEVRGVVQGVGFRPWVGRTARRLGLTGEVRNTVRGVTIDAFGSAAALDALARCVAHDAPTAARVREVLSTPIAPRPSVAFTIAPSETSGEPIVALPPDLPTCDACLADVRRPEGRHHGYVFTSCAECGPRLSIAVALPYDRAATTMAPFEPCDSCSVEYASPEDRRFHAQTIACPVCGPRAWLADRRGIEMASSDVVEAAAKRLDEGRILAVQGLGAFHLMCDATNPGAVARMRREKRREAQPFAVMVADVTAAEAIADLDGAAREALTSRPRPIVLAPTRASAVAAEVNGPSRRTGILLPYTPLTHRLAVRVGRPIVVTSGNTSGGPAIIERGEAMARLGSIADAFLLSDRPIARRVEDSVVAASATGTRIVRRGRGFAPLPIRLPCSSPEPVLAVGGHTKNTACLVVDDLAYLTPHLGDLGWVEGEAAWRRDIESFERLLRVRADVLAHDLHPDYASTRLAFARPARRRVGVQHHVAHVLSTLAELHIGEPVVGVVFDGTGWGGDGTLWGSELLLVDGGQWTRALTFRPMSLPGGEAAIRDVWRAALAVLVDAYGRDEALVLAARLRVLKTRPTRWWRMRAVRTTTG